MKNKQSIIALALVLISAAIATEPAKEANPNPEALQLIQSRIAARLERSFPPFSRVRPPQPQTQFHPELLVDGEKRLPFEVREPAGGRIFLQGADPGPQVLVSGYLRLSDNAIFIFDTKRQQHIPADHDPRFATPSQTPKAEEPT